MREVLIAASVVIFALIVYALYLRLKVGKWRRLYEFVRESLDEIAVERSEMQDRHREDIRYVMRRYDVELEAARERERAALNQIVRMKRAGFEVVDDTPLDSWVLDDAHEAEVSDRRNGRDKPAPGVDLLA